VHTDHGDVLTETYDYDIYGRLTEKSRSRGGLSTDYYFLDIDMADLVGQKVIEHSIHAEPIMYDFNYDEGGRVDVKKLAFGQEDLAFIDYQYTSATQLENLLYYDGSQNRLHRDKFYYNSRGWLYQINDLPLIPGDYFVDGKKLHELTAPGESQTHQLDHNVVLRFNLDSLKNPSSTHFSVRYLLESNIFESGEELISSEWSKFLANFVKYQGEEIEGEYPYTDSIEVFAHGYYENEVFLEHIRNEVHSYFEHDLGLSIEKELELAGMEANTISIRAIEWLLNRLERDMDGVIPDRGGKDKFDPEDICVIFYQKKYFDSPNHPLGAEAQFNGNIAHMEWVIADSDKRRYGFSYDGFDRLLSANYMDHGNSLADYSVGITYEDLAGNISTIERYGLLNPNSHFGPVYGMIDRLVMGYSGNQLVTVSELAPQPGPDLGYIGHGTTMTYDVHGNLSSCTQRSIGDITYNHRHQPIEFFAQDENLAITYDDEGNKIEQRYLENGVPTDIIKYEGGAIFTNGDLSAYNFGEGRIIPGDGPTGEWQLEFIIRDHLGNSRVWISDLDGNGHINCEEEILQVRDYYPFGMPHDLPEEVDLPSLPYRDADPFTYNNKEYEERVTRMHDYHARWYDAALGRWSVVDPLADHAPEWTPYRYGFNNPIIYIDPDGLFETRDDALEYARDNNIKIRPRWFIGKLFTSGSRSNIVEHSDGTFAIEHGNTSISDLGGDLGVMTAVKVSPEDVVDISEKDDKMLATQRDGTTIDITNMPVSYTGFPNVGAGRYKKILSSIKSFDKFKTVFRNDKGKLPTKTESGKSIKYDKVDIDKPPSPVQRQHGAVRSKRRLIRGSDGSYYYTGDHYRTFQRIKIPQQ